MTTKFEVYSNFTKVSGDVDEETLDEATRFRKSGYQHSNAFKKRAWDGYTRLYMKKQRVFPTGLLDRIIRIYKKKHSDFEYEIDDRRKFKSKEPTVRASILDGITLRRHQVIAANAMVRKRHGVLWAATNSGKTEISIATLKALDLPALFLVKGKDLLHQSYERFQKRLGAKDVGIVSSSTWDVRKFTVASADTLSRRLVPKKNATDPKVLERQQRVKDLLESVQVVVIDECHQAASTGLWNVVRVCTAPYRFGLSGTPFKRGDKQDLKLIALTGEVIYKISNKEMIEDGVSVPVDIKMISIEHPKIAPYLDYNEVYTEGIEGNTFRNDIICKLTDSYYTEGKQVLILVKKINHGHILDELLYTYKPDAFIPHQFIHGGTDIRVRQEALKDFKSGMIKVLIASVILDVGVDIPNIDILILAGGGASEIRTLQRIGRGLRLNKGKDNLTVIDFSDTGHRYLAQHSLSRLESYDSEDCFNISPIDGFYVSEFA